MSDEGPTQTPAAPAATAPPSGAAYRLRYAAVTDVGRHRKENQDSGYASPHLLVVADGVGGAAYGDVASSTAVHLLKRLDAPPAEEIWCATALDPDRRPPAAASLLSFITTPDATHAMIARPGGVPAGRFRAPVYVTIWSEPRRVH